MSLKGRTKTKRARLLQINTKEHQKLVRMYETDKSRLAQHASEEDHRIECIKKTTPQREDFLETVYLVVTPIE
ncbi:hypothetical protein Trydic_g12511 [Trypoxylus dichotomus]